MALVLLLAAGALSIFLLAASPVSSQRYSHHLNRALQLKESGRKGAAWTALRQAARHAFNHKEWQGVLQAGEGLISSREPSSLDYRRFSTLAGRATAFFPDREDYLAYWLWGLLRQGKGEKALSWADSLKDPVWQGLKAEILLTAEYGPQGLQELAGRLQEGTDPELFWEVGTLMQSAVLAFDAFLLYLGDGQIDKAYALALALDDPQQFPGGSGGRPIMDAARARAAQDARQEEQAIFWMQRRLEDAEKRRAATWVDHHFLGDLFWNQYLYTGQKGYQAGAEENWKQAGAILENSEARINAKAWRLPLNLFIVLSSQGRNREAEFFLEKALTDYGNHPEVMVHYAENKLTENPGLAQRLLAGASHPLLQVSYWELLPQTISPQLYEAALWELLERVLEDNTEEERGEAVPERTARRVTLFLMNFLVGRNDWKGLDIVVSRYRRAWPRATWPLEMRLAADAARGYGVVDLLPPFPREGQGPPSSYEEYRESLLPSDWKSWYNASLFAFAAAHSLNEILGDRALVFDKKGIFDEGKGRELFLLNMIENESNDAGVRGTPLGDRMNALLAAYSKERKELSLLNRNSKKADSFRAALLMEAAKEAARLRDNALKDLQKSLDGLKTSNPPGGGTPTDRARIYYLRALIYRDAGRSEEARRAALQALDMDPNLDMIKEFRELKIN